ncbi:MAG: hypothetical protein IPI58_00810 [Alphaproteobacteria bacterium]|nr:MAG: hypothetical protein IPI58_00810 [Alphaproteobacteria bacterium]
MSTPSPSNIFSGKSPEQAWRIARCEITARHGGVLAFDHKGYSLSYTGPDVIVSPEKDLFIPYAPRIDNLKRTDQMVQELLRQGIPVVWLDGSPIGKFLFIENKLYVGIKEYFLSQGVTDPNVIKAGGDYVMSRVSRSYIKSAFGYGATAVCGADHKRIFYHYEMPALVNNDKIVAVNELPRKMVHDFYAISKDEAFQVICWAELLLSKGRMEANDNEDTRRDFHQRQYFLNGERKLMASRVVPLSKKWEHKREEKREEIFSNYAGLICNDALKNMLTEVRPLCPTVVSFPAHVGKKAYKI